MAIGTPVLIGSLANKINTATYNIALTGAIQTGDLVLVNIAHAAAFTVVSVSDGTNTYAPAVWTSAAGSHYGTYYKQNATAVASGNVTVTLSGHSNSSLFASTVCRVPGIAAVALDSGVNAANTAQSGTNYTQSAAGITAVNNEIVITNIAINGPIGDTAPTWASSFLALARTGTAGQAASSNLTIATGYRIVASRATYTATATLGSSRAWNGNITAFQGADQSLVGLPAATPLVGGAIEFTAAAFHQRQPIPAAVALVGAAPAFGAATVPPTITPPPPDPEGNLRLTAVSDLRITTTGDAREFLPAPIYNYTLAASALSAGAASFGVPNVVATIPGGPRISAAGKLRITTTGFYRRIVVGRAVTLTAISLSGGTPSFGSSPLGGVIDLRTTTASDQRVTSDGSLRRTAVPTERVAVLTATPLVTGQPSFGSALVIRHGVVPFTATSLITSSPSFGSASLILGVPELYVLAAEATVNQSPSVESPPGFTAS